MNFNDLDVTTVAKLVLHLVEQATCMECCKYYAVPTKATCGHSLCYSCWRMRSTCPSCGLQVKKSELFTNLSLQSLTEQVQLLESTFEKIFKVKLAEFINYNTTEARESTLEEVKSIIQILSERKNKPVPVEVVRVAPMQVDWDKIEEIPETENVNKTNKHGKYSNNVERKKKKISKLNKNNRNKLNVSKEMCKKTLANKAVEVNFQNNLYDTDDSTPEVIDGNKVTEASSDDSHVEEIKDNGNLDVNNDGNVSKKQSIVSENIATIDCVNNEICAINEHYTHDEMTVCNVNTHKSALNKENTIQEDVNENNILYDENPKSDYVVNSDDIEITIKIGNTLTNLFIKKKDNDVQLKIDSNGKVQINNVNLNANNEKATVSSVITENKLNNTDTAINMQRGKIGENIIVKSATSKTSSVEKNTASAETATANFEFTDSVKSELSDILDDAQLINEQNKKILTNPESQKSIQEDMEYLNDLDIFDSESVKEENVQLLKTSKNTPSAILMLPMKSGMIQSLKDKRHIGVVDLDEIPKTKKIKLTNTRINDNLIDDSEILELSKPQNGEQNQISESENNIEKEKNKSYSQIDDVEIIELGTPLCDDDSDENKNLNANNEKATVSSVITENKLNNTDTAINMQRGKIGENIIVKSATSKTSSVEKNTASAETATANFEFTDSVESELSDILDDAQLINEQNKKILTNPESQKSIQEDMEYLNDLDIFDSESVKEENVQLLKTSKNTPSAILMLPMKSGMIQSLKDKRHIGVVDLDEIPKTKKIKLTNTRINDNLIDDSEILELSKPQNGEQNQISESENNIEKEKNKSYSQIDDVEIIELGTPLCDDDSDENTQQLLLKNNSPSSLVSANTTQEREFMQNAFVQSQSSPQHSSIGKNHQKGVNLCVGGSYLTTFELANLIRLCVKRNWTYLDKYSKELTHLVVGVDEENKSQRTVKYMCALAASKWIVSYKWVKKSLKTTAFVEEEPYEVLDDTGEPGPRRSRIAKQKLFNGISFYCMPPFSLLDADTLKSMVQAAGGRVLRHLDDACASAALALVLAEPEREPDERFTYLAMGLGVVPVKYEWLLNCLSRYTLVAINDHLLCSATTLSAITSKWPSELISRD